MANPLPTSILILAAGHPATVANDRDEYPICLSEMDNRPLLEHIVANVATVPNPRFIYALRDQEVRKFHLDSVVELLTPGATTVRIPEGTQGAACTALLAACDIHPDAELLIVSANELVSVDLGRVIQGFRERDLAGGVLVFRSVHPRYSYVRLNEDDLVTEATHRNPVSQHATAGIFWFRHAGEFVEAVKGMIRKDSHVDGSFYICPALNEMILKHLPIGAVRIPSAAYTPIKNERQLSMYEHGALAGVR